MRVLALLALIGCTTAEALHCPIDRLCPPGTVCEPAHESCVPQGDLDACSTASDGDDCTTVTNEMGHCDRGVCFAEGCGDYRIDGTEECDGDQFRDGRDTCMELGFYGGADRPVTCTKTCTADRSACAGLGICGDGMRDDGEDCDGSIVDADASRCDQVGFYNDAMLGCNSLCHFDTSACEGRCGDGIRNGTEICDGAPPTQSCVDLGYDAGRSQCGACFPDFSACARWNWTTEGTVGSVQAIGGISDADYYVATTDRLLHVTNGSFVDVSMGGPSRFARVAAADAAHVYVTTHDNLGDGLRMFDGHTWSTIDFAGDGDYPYELHVRSPTDLYVAGQLDLYHFDGTAWSGLGLPRVDQIASDGTRLVAVANKIAYERTGTTWTAINTGAYEAMATFAIGSDFYVAARDAGGRLFVGHSRAAGSWTTQAIAAQPGNVNALRMTGTSPSDLYLIAGFSLMHFDGTAWYILPPASVGTLWSSPEGTVFASWDMALHAYRGTTTRQLSLVDTPYAITGFGPDTIAAVSDTSLYVLAPDHRSWQQTSIGPVGYVDVWGVSAHDVFVIGQGIAHYDVTANPPTLVRAEESSTYFYDGRLWGSAANDVYAISASLALHYNGTAWSPIALPSIGYSYTDVWGTGPTDVWIVAGGGIAFHFDGIAWTQIPTGTTSGLRAMWGVARDNAYVVGNDGVLLHWNGTAFTVETIGFYQFTSIWGRSDRDIYASTASTILHYDGVTWSPIRAAGGYVWGTGPSVFLLGPNFAFSTIEVTSSRRWSCATLESACGDGTDDDCDGLYDAADPDCAELLLSEVHGGSPDYFEIVNHSAHAMQLDGVTITSRFGADTSTTSGRFPSDAHVDAGKTFRFLDLPASLVERERALGFNITDQPGATGWVALCAGPCDLTTCSNFLDYFVKSNGVDAVSNPPACAAMTGGPVDVSSLPNVSGSTSTQSPIRTGFTGRGTTAQHADWMISTATRD